MGGNESKAMIPTIYTASKTTHAEKWRDLRSLGWSINASWIDESGEGESGEYSELSQRCLNEAIMADFVLLYCEEGEILKGALIEVGAALGTGKVIRCVGECPSLSRVFRKHPKWEEYSSIQTAIHAPL